MSQEHKSALALGRLQARSIKSYLKTIDKKKPGRPVTKESLEKRLQAVSDKIKDSDDPLRTVDLLQTKLDIESALSDAGLAEDMDALVGGFVQHAKAYSQRKGISYTAWRQMGVPAAVLKAAGIPETRRR